MPSNSQSETTNMRKDSGVCEVNKSDIGKLLESHNPWAQKNLAELD